MPLTVERNEFGIYFHGASELEHNRFTQVSFKALSKRNTGDEINITGDEINIIIIIIIIINLNPYRIVSIIIWSTGFRVNPNSVFFPVVLEPTRSTANQNQTGNETIPCIPA